MLISRSRFPHELFAPPAIGRHMTHKRGLKRKGILMTLKTIIPATVILCALITGEASAQAIGGADSDQTGAPIPLAPGNPNTSTIVTPEVPSTPMGDAGSSSDISSDDRPDINIIMPSSGGHAQEANIYATAPSNMNYDQFTGYLDKQWGVNGNAQITASQWNEVDPAYFGGRKPAFDTLAPSYGSPVDARDLQPVYSGLYQRYLKYTAQDNYTAP
jgi:hypothetical protein